MSLSPSSTEQIDDFEKVVLSDPHQAYRVLRADGPVRKMQMPDGMKAWVITRYDEARAALADPALQKAPPAGGMAEQGLQQLDDDFSDDLAANLITVDPPEHTRLRKLVTKAFTSRRVEALRPRIEQIADELLDEMANHTEVDLLDAFAFPLPMTVICEFLGVPDEDRDDFRQWSKYLLDVDSAEAGPVSASMAAYLMRLIATKRDDPGDDLLTALIQARDDDDRLSEQELVSMVFVLLLAGHETTVSLISNGVLALLRHPEQLAALTADPGLLPGAVEEFLRFDGPIHLATLRWATTDLTLHGASVAAGEPVLVSLLSANRDASRFDDPDRFDITRKPESHLAFGHGIHYCLGAALARLEGEIAFGRLLARFPDLSLAGEPEALQWRHSTLIRGVERLPVRLAA
ncbi:MULTISPECIES: cytochrome P450 family protein [Actinoalloteichus]|uniref:Cytochrome P450 n=1 Tax=Actinoalloteichus fjordicus TaxID=1612552 RepID=A0AAC9LAZ1_9PSEU|nr:MULTISPECIES: cytochrome P450 [Actinoalloteichus]APU14021.1 cytochrome P450 [Actinoalloteichus fjordicus]APU19967.1 cytochrome P450 [Actinoalloteichus sp. GBA129-24]